MKSLCVILFIFVMINLSGCYSPIKGKVIDGVTGRPIEGALVVVLWTKKHGFGLTYHSLSMITETLTDKEGTFRIAKTPNDQFVERPRMIIYKEGYIPWRNDMIFPGGTDKLSKNHEWNNNATYKLELMNNSISIEQLSDFIDYGMMFGIDEVPMFHKLIGKMQSSAHDEVQKKINSDKSK